MAAAERPFRSSARTWIQSAPWRKITPSRSRLTSVLTLVPHMLGSSWVPPTSAPCRVAGIEENRGRADDLAALADEEGHRAAVREPRPDALVSQAASAGLARGDVLPRALVLR